VIQRSRGILLQFPPQLNQGTRGGGVAPLFRPLSRRCGRRVLPYTLCLDMMCVAAFGELGGKVKWDGNPAEWRKARL
jgi:hypothetical protein